MNIEKLKKLIELSNLLNDNSETLSEKEPTKNKKSLFEWEYVLVRWYDAWVWAWKLIDWTKWNIILEDARMLWRWWAKEWIWLSWVATKWLADRDEVKVLETQSKVLINDDRVSTFYICTKEVEKQIREYKVADQTNN